MQNQIEIVVNYIEDHVKDPFDCDRLAEIDACSKSHFFKQFTLLTGYTPMNYVLRRKLQFASKQLITGKEKIIDVAFEFGFESHDVFSRAFKIEHGVLDYYTTLQFFERVEKR